MACGSGHALAIIMPTAIVQPAVAAAMLVPKLFVDAGENASRLRGRRAHPSHLPYVEVLGRRYRAPTVKRQAAQTSRKSITSIAKVGASWGR
jgi:hypothetical protein